MTEYAGREQEIEAREKAATAGPIVEVDVESFLADPTKRSFTLRLDDRPSRRLVWGNWKADRKFYLYAREDIPYLLVQLREAREEIGRLYKAVEAKEKQVAGQKRTLHKVKSKWDASMREGEQLAAALAHLLAWARPSASQQVEAEVETAIEELEKYREAHPRLDRILKGGD